MNESFEFLPYETFEKLDPRHCEARSNEAISWFIEWLWDCFVGLRSPRNDKQRVFQRSPYVVTPAKAGIRKVLKKWISANPGPDPRALNFYLSCHCEARSAAAISRFIEWLWDCFVGLWPPRNDKWRVFQSSRSGVRRYDDLPNFRGNSKLSGSEGFETTGGVYERAIGERNRDR